MTVTYEAISSQTLASATGTVTFSSIASTYTDLRLIISTKTVSANAATSMRFNSDSATNYSYTRLYGNGTSPTSDRVSSSTVIDVQFIGTGTFNTTTVDVMNYANSTTYKTALIRWNTAGDTGFTGTNVGLWRSTAAITSLSFLSANDFAIGSTFSLYGIKAE
jgi:hypothetical protein